MRDSDLTLQPTPPALGVIVPRADFMPQVTIQIIIRHRLLAAQPLGRQSGKPTSVCVWGLGPMAPWRHCDRQIWVAAPSDYEPHILGGSIPDLLFTGDSLGELETLKRASGVRGNSKLLTHALDFTFIAQSLHFSTQL